MINLETGASQLHKAHKRAQNPILYFSDCRGGRLFLISFLFERGNLNTTVFDVLVKADLAKVSLWTYNLALSQDVVLDFIGRLLPLSLYKFDVSFQLGNLVGGFAISFLEFRHSAGGFFQLAIFLFELLVF